MRQNSALQRLPSYPVRLWTRRQSQALPLAVSLFCISLLTACQWVIQPPDSVTKPAASAQRAKIAFVRNHTVFINDDLLATELVAVPCPRPDCTPFTFRHLAWSPDGTKLAYFLTGYEANGSVVSELHIADRAGKVKILAKATADFYPAAWSPNSQQIAFLAQDDDTNFFIWRADVTDLAMPIYRQLGRVQQKVGCGGGGNSSSNQLYEEEGAFGRFGYNALRLIWTKGNILLFSNACSAIGMGRFDMTQATELEPYANLHSLVYNLHDDTWAAIAATEDTGFVFNPSGEVLVGSPSTTDYKTLVDAGKAAAVYWGERSNRLYYSVRNASTIGDLGLDGLIAESGHTTLWAMNLATQAKQQLCASPDYGYTRLAELSADQPIFGVIESGEPGYAAFQKKVAATEAAEKRKLANDEQYALYVHDYTPHQSIARCQPGQNKPEILIANAGQVAVSVAE